jgi:hypothetical protein
MPWPRLRCPEEGAGQDEGVGLGAGLVSGPEAIARIVITDETGVEQQVPVVDGWVAFAGTVTKQAAGELHVAVHAADGSVLAEYDAGD